jgi:DNA-directed RNA polymerase
MMETFNGIQYCKINIANTFGNDKLSWKDRIDWVDGQTNLYDLIDKAKEPMLMIKGINALEAAKQGEPTGFIMGLDATASGPQIMACVTRCKKTAEQVNLVDTGKRECLYDNMGRKMGVDRKIIKHPVMTYFYGSTAQPKMIFGEETKELKKFYKTLHKKLPGAVLCMEIIQDLWDPEASHYRWTLPDGHHVVMPVLHTVDKKVEIDELDHATFTYRTTVVAPAETGLALAANVIHSIDGYICREMVRKAHQQGFHLLTIHDSFWAHPNYMNQVRKNYVDILARISRSNVLDSVLSELSGQTIKVEKASVNLHKHITNANYALS